MSVWMLFPLILADPAVASSIPVSIEIVVVLPVVKDVKEEHTAVSNIWIAIVKYCFSIPSLTCAIVSLIFRSV